MSLFSILLLMFAGMFWVFRIVVAVMATMQFEFVFMPLDLTTEIILLFVTLFSLILLVKRNIIGALIYLLSYAGYFGVYLYNSIIKIANEGEMLIASDYANLLVSFVAIVIAVITFFDIAVTKTSSGNAKNKHTDWFFKNEKYERKLDERADKNQYKM